MWFILVTARRKPRQQKAGAQAIVHADLVRSACGVIGSRARLRIWCRKAWGFESLHAHKTLTRAPAASSRCRLCRFAGNCRSFDNNFRNKTFSALNITLNKKNTTDASLTIQLQENDYLTAVEGKVKEYSRKATIKGFRQGKIPAGVIKKMFGRTILVEEVNQLVSSSISNYIRDNKLKVLGDPMPNVDKARLIDWETQKDFEFEFQIGLVEDFKVDLGSSVKIKRWVIKVDQNVMNDTLADLKKRFGNVSYPEASTNDCNLFGDLQASGSDEKKSTYLPVEKIAKKEQKKFIGVRKGDVVAFDIQNLFGDAETLAQTLNTSKEEASQLTGAYTFSVTNISQVAPAEMNQEFFDKVFGKEVVTTENDFIQKVKETISGNYQRESEHMLDHEIQHYFEDHTSINLPDEFLKQWLKSTSNGQVNDDILEKEFNAYRNSLKWDLVKNQVAEMENVKVEAEDVKQRAKEMITEQFGGPGVVAALGDKLDSIADNYLSGQDGQNFMRIFNQVRHERILAGIKAKISITDKEVTLDEFRKHAEEHRH
jgi:trigger factor